VYTLAVRIWGLTGNIGSGKSTVGRMLMDRGIPVVDADLVAREVVQPGRPALREIASRFPGSVRADGSLDRKALAARVFADPGERAALNAIVHPRIADEVAERMAGLAAAGEKVAVYEAALIVENGLQQGLDGLIVVTAPPEVQIARLRLRDAMSDDEARARISAQLSAAEKARAATVVIDNGGSEGDLKAQVELLVERLRREQP
jgi:dephospho-CoA kinase